MDIRNEEKYEKMSVSRKIRINLLKKLLVIEGDNEFVNIHDTR